MPSKKKIKKYDPLPINNKLSQGALIESLRKYLDVDGEIIQINGISHLKVHNKTIKVKLLKHLLENIANSQNSSKTILTEDELKEIMLNKKVVIYSKLKAKNESQEQYMKVISENDITLCTGPAGTGKTLISVHLALQALEQGKIAKIIITRPAVEVDEKLGFLPGTLEEKLHPYLIPIYDALLYFVGKTETLDKMIEENIIEIAPLAYMRGRTLANAFVILDEAQNTTMNQIQMFMTRIGDKCKMVINGDTTQMDLRSASGFINLVLNIEQLNINDKKINKLGIFEFQNKDIIRNKIIIDLLENNVFVPYDLNKFKVKKEVSKSD